jgi:hypothetical protein
VSLLPRERMRDITSDRFALEKTSFIFPPVRHTDSTAPVSSD